MSWLATATNAADVAEPVGVEATERIEIGVGEGSERHRQDVELARLDERQEERQRAFEFGHLDLGPALRPAALPEGHGWAGPPAARRP